MLITIRAPEAPAITFQIRAGARGPLVRLWRPDLEELGNHLGRTVHAVLYEARALYRQGLVQDRSYRDTAYWILERVRLLDAAQGPPRSAPWEFSSRTRRRLLHGRADERARSERGGSMLVVLTSGPGVYVRLRISAGRNGPVVSLLTPYELLPADARLQVRAVLRAHREAYRRGERQLWSYSTTAVWIRNYLRDLRVGAIPPAAWEFSRRTATEITSAQAMRVARLGGQVESCLTLPQPHQHPAYGRINGARSPLPFTFLRAANEGGDAQAFYGVELEVDARPHENAPNTSPIPGRVAPVFFCREDGSLTNGPGVELVSHPATEGWWRKERPFVEGVLRWLKDEGWASYDARTCGMHIHVARTAFDSAAHMYKFSRLLCREYDLVLTVSQRDPSALDRWAAPVTCTRTIRGKAGLPRGLPSETRYHAVNMTAKTAEVRIFRGTLRPESFYKNLQFVWAALAYSRFASLRHLNATNFLAFVAANREQYPELFDFLKDRGKIKEVAKCA